MKSDLVEIECEIRMDDPSKKAVAVADGSVEVDENCVERERWFWLPRSLVDFDPAGYRDKKTVVATMPEWLALEKGLV